MGWERRYETVHLILLTKEHMVHLLKMHLLFCATRVSFSELPASFIVQYGTLVA